MCKKFRVPPTYVTLFPGSFPLLTHDFDLCIICSTDTYPVSAVPIRVYTKTVPRLWICTCFCVILQCQIISYLTSLHWSKQLFTNSKMKKGRGHSKSVPHRQICHIVSQLQFLLPTDSRHLILIFLLLLVGGWLRFELWLILADALVHQNSSQRSNNKCNGASYYCNPRSHAYADSLWWREQWHSMQSRTGLIARI